ncbi:MAG: hypothetical protein V4582_13070 [Pseudomonadota bacterium]
MHPVRRHTSSRRSTCLACLLSTFMALPAPAASAQFALAPAALSQAALAQRALEPNAPDPAAFAPALAGSAAAKAPATLRAPAGAILVPAQAPAPDPAPAPAPASAPPVAGLGTALPPEQLTRKRGGSDSVSNEASLSAVVSGNTSINVNSGANVIQGGSFAYASGLPTVIQNSGSNVLIQNAIVINLQIK